MLKYLGVKGHSVCNLFSNDSAKIMIIITHTHTHTYTYTQGPAPKMPLFITKS